MGESSTTALEKMGRFGSFRQSGHMYDCIMPASIVPYLVCSNSEQKG